MDIGSNSYAWNLLHRVLVPSHWTLGYTHGRMRFEAMYDPDTRDYLGMQMRWRNPRETAQYIEGDVGEWVVRAYIDGNILYRPSEIVYLTQPTISRIERVIGLGTDYITAVKEDEHNWIRIYRRKPISRIVQKVITRASEDFGSFLISKHNRRT